MHHFCDWMQQINMCNSSLQKNWHSPNGLTHKLIYQILRINLTLLYILVYCTASYVNLVRLTPPVLYSIHVFARVANLCALLILC
jgi:hypothetical protein